MSDPYQTLGVTPEDGDEAIHDAYLNAIKACPPERDPARFEAVRAAYETLRTRRDRLALALFDATPPTPAELLDRAAPLQPPRRPPLALVQALLRAQARGER